MKQAEKCVLIPFEKYERFKSPETEIDKEIWDIMKNNTFSEKEKLQAYNDVFKKLFNVNFNQSGVENGTLKNELLDLNNRISEKDEPNFSESKVLENLVEEEERDDDEEEKEDKHEGLADKNLLPNPKIIKPMNIKKRKTISKWIHF